MRKIWLPTILFSLIALISLIALTSPKPLFASLPAVAASDAAKEGTTVRFVYDGDGARVGKIEGGKTTVYVGDMEKNLNSGEITRYYSIGSKRVAVKTSLPAGGEGSSLSFLVSDHLGSLRILSSLSDLNSSSIKKISYFPYGSIRTQTGTLLSRQYTGQINDNSTGLYFYNARYYNPSNATFMQADLAGSSLNKYNYTSGNPIRFFDSSGNDPVDSLALYLCQSEQPDCTNLSQRWWGGTSQEALEGWGGRGAAANRALDIGKSMYDASVTNGVDPHFAATRTVPNWYIESLPFDIQDYKYDILSLNRARVTNINIALILAIGMQETALERDMDITNANRGFNFLSYESLLLKKPDAFYNPGPDNNNILTFIYNSRIIAGYSQNTLNNPGQTFSLISQSGNINFDLLKFYSGEGNYNDLWARKVQAYYSAFVKFANEYSEEYGWLLSDLNQFSNPSKPKYNAF